MSSVDSSDSSSHVQELYDALASLLNAPDLNLDELEDETRKSIDQALRTMERYESTSCCQPKCHRPTK